MTFVQDIDLDRFGQKSREREALRGPSKEDMAAFEVERKEKQKEVRLKLAAAEISDKKYSELRSQLDTIEGEKDLLTVENTKACQPINAKLKELDDQQIQLVADKKPTDEKLSEQQAELIQQIRSKVAELGKELDTRDRLSFQISAEMVKQKKQRPQVAPSELLNYARSDLLGKMRAADAWRSRAHEMLWKVQEDGKFHSGERYKAELAIAEEFFELMNTKAVAAHQAAIDE